MKGQTTLDFRTELSAPLDAGLLSFVEGLAQYQPLPVRKPDQYCNSVKLQDYPPSSHWTFS